jgi:CRP-like cAMP-binding protein
MVTRDNALEIARGSGWLSRQPAKFQDELLSRCHLRSYREKETIYHVGDPAVGVFCLVSGAVRVEFAAAGGDCKIASVLQPVSWFGQDACFRRGGNVLAMSAALPVSALHVTPQDFERLIENPAHCRAFALLTLEHVDDGLQVLGQMLIGDVEQRIALRLALLAERPDRRLPAVIPLTQADLAEMCGLSRPTVQHVLAGLERRGLIKAGYRRIEILDLSGLLSRAAGDAAARAGSAA